MVDKSSEVAMEEAEEEKEVADARPEKDCLAVPFRFTPPEWPSLRLPIDKEQIIRAVGRTEDDIRAFLSMETNLIGQGYYQRPNSMASIHQAVFGPPNENLQKINLNGFRALQVTRFLGRRFRLGPVEMRDGLSQFDLYDTEYEQFCPAIPRCSEREKYRTIDGSCNNLNEPIWGKSNTQYSRMMPPAYSDGISEFRRSVTGGPLPLARVLSTELTFTSSKLDRNLNVMFMQWGQFLDHDTTLGSSTRATNGQGLLCCNRTHLEDPVFHPACRPIIIPRRDPFYSRFNRRCNNFVRNAVGMKNNCNLGYREQTNVITSYLDASMVYGNQENRSRIVRTFKDGLLRVSRINKRDFLPYDTMNNSIEHNRLARELKKLNRHWSDETIFQEARRIVGAEIQQITYNEWLPLALGRNTMKATGLMLMPEGFCTDYNPAVNPAILNEFASAAFRWHTLVQGFYQLMSENGQVRENYQMRKIFNNPSLLYRDGAIDEATYGLVAAKSEAFDPIFIDDIKNFLFPAGQNATFGMDLVSINIQRGRDHGMPPYNVVRRACGLPPVRDFRQLNSILQRGSAARFAEIYDHVDDIDLFVGGVHELPLPEGILGPTFACIVAEQFRRLKYGDRFWFENGGMAHSFSDRQLNELRKVTLAGVICANGDRIRKMQPFAMVAKHDRL
ncbi:PREDICTED: chorion peroxidase-like, partial [Rhagoletis zephyria]|uniref:chorion peroxidase-like n=1 Tax=Rhagoletis zephyria TaxID=28612 RepID=UPI0008119D4E